MSAAFTPRPGPRNLIGDVPGLRVGHAHDEAARSGVTVILPDAPCPAAADVRGGGPGTREIEALSAENQIARAHAVVLAGGSALGLGAADAVAAALSAMGRGVIVAPGHPPVPIVPAAILYDLGPHNHAAYAAEGPPHPRLGRAALAAALAGDGEEIGAIGAGRGAVAGALKGGVGSCSLMLAPGLIVGALVAANPVGSTTMGVGGPFWAWPYELDGEFGGERPGPAWRPDPSPIPRDGKMRIDPGALFADLGHDGDGSGDPGVVAGANTAIGVIAVNADLTAAECKRLAIMAQDGLARAIRPAHTPFDGDTIFALATGGAALGEGPMRAARLAAIGSAAADCVARAVARAVHAARSGPDETPCWHAARGL
jgi:L-aminopeptidase/D-esterase-like protein